MNNEMSNEIEIWREIIIEPTPTKSLRVWIKKELVTSTIMNMLNALSVWGMYDSDDGVQLSWEVDSRNDIGTLRGIIIRVFKYDNRKVTR